MRRVVIVQARMTSTRLPGKVLLDLAGRPMLERQLERLAALRARGRDRPRDDDQAGRRRRSWTLRSGCGVRWHRGSEHDVLARYAGAARSAGADLVVRVTSDCPLIDPAETDTVIAELEERRERATTRPTGSSRTFRAGSTPRRYGATRSSGWTAWRRRSPRAST